MEFREELNDILDNFTDNEQKYINRIVREDHGLDKEGYFVLIKITRTIDEDTVQADKDLYIELLEDIFLGEITPKLWFQDEGSDWFIEITKRSDDDWDNYILLARDEDDTALTDDTQAGQTYASSSTETVRFIDFSLTKDTWSKIRILLEDETGGTANGDALELLFTVWVYAKDSIDSA